MNARLLTVDEASALVGRFLRDAGFAGFIFDTGFTLVFDRGGGGPDGPSRVRLQVDAGISVGDHDSWTRLVEQMAPQGHVEPDEPVLAFELARIRWTSGSEVESWCLQNESLTINMRSGDVLHIECSTDDPGRSWTLQEDGVTEANSRWSLVAEAGQFFGRTPSLGAK